MEQFNKEFMSELRQRIGYIDLMVWVLDGWNKLMRKPPGCELWSQLRVLLDEHERNLFVKEGFGTQEGLTTISQTLATHKR
jgi:hypothetical protein